MNEVLTCLETFSGLVDHPNFRAQTYLFAQGLGKRGNAIDEYKGDSFDFESETIPPLRMHVNAYRTFDFTIPRSLDRWPVVTDRFRERILKLPSIRFVPVEIERAIYFPWSFGEFNVPGRYVGENEKYLRSFPPVETPPIIKLNEMIVKRHRLVKDEYVDEPNRILSLPWEVTPEHRRYAISERFLTENPIFMAGTWLVFTEKAWSLVKDLIETRLFNVLEKQLDIS